jgi:hypothetical protein
MLLFLFGGTGGEGEAYLSFYVEKCPHVPKILVMGQSMDSF